MELDIEPTFVQYDFPDSPKDFVISKNLRRRHLDDSQRGYVMASLIAWHPGKNSTCRSGNSSLSREDAAAIANVSTRTISRGMLVHRDGSEALKAEVMEGRVTLTSAESVVKMLPDKGHQETALLVASSEGTTVEVAAKKIKPKMLGEYITLTKWSSMTEAQRQQSMLNSVSQSKFNRQDNDSIEWADWSWNPVTGCKHDCPYCYARDIAERFYDQGFEPSFWPGRLSAPHNTNPLPGPAGKNVFSNSMSDLYGRWVPKQWIDLVLQTMRENDQWNFLMLTKFPKRAAEFAYSPNCWIGTSVDLQVRVKAAEDAFEKIDCGVKWLSIEPMIEPIKFSRPELFNWVVIGGASKSTQTPEWIPPFEWIVRVAGQFLEHGAKIYLKENGRPKEFPGVITPQNAGDVFHYLKHEKVA